MEFLGNGSGARSDLPPGAMGLVSRYSLVTPRTLGDTTALQVLFALRNQTVASAPRIVRVNRLFLFADCTAALTGFLPLIRALKAVASAIGGGTALPKSFADSLLAGGTSALIDALCGTASDGGAATAITGGTGAPGVASANAYGGAMSTTMHSATGQRYVSAVALFEEPLIVRAGECITVTLGAPATQNAATVHYVVRAECEEFTS